MCAPVCFFFSSRRRHTRCSRDWSSDVCSSDLAAETYSATANAGTDFAWSYDKEIQFTARGSWHQSALGNIRYIDVAEAPMNPPGVANGVEIGRASCRERV